MVLGSPEVISLDTGGTMTDSFLVSSEGDFTVGKAPTTPEDESEGIFNSINDSLEYWNASLEESAGSVEALVYSGTAMLNRLIEREGNDNIGLITNAGFEDLHRMGRAIQGWVGLDYAGRLHAREHKYPDPLIPRSQIIGVRGRINFWGDEVVPLYEEEAEEVLEEFDIEAVKLPKLDKKDPVVKAIDAEPGDVVKVTRESETAGEAVIYRYVIG